MYQNSAERDYKPLLNQKIHILAQREVTLELVAGLESKIGIRGCGAHLNELCKEVDESQVLVNFVLFNFKQALTTIDLLSYKLVK